MDGVKHTLSPANEAVCGSVGGCRVRGESCRARRREGLRSPYNQDAMALSSEMEAGGQHHASRQLHGSRREYSDADDLEFPIKAVVSRINGG